MTILTSQGKNEYEDEKIWKNDFSFWILHYKIKLCGSFMKIRENFFDQSCKTFLTNQGKNEDEDEKIKENDFEFWILIENSQKATLNLYFKSRFYAKPSKFPIYFAHDCQWK